MLTEEARRANLPRPPASAVGTRIARHGPPAQFARFLTAKGRALIQTIPGRTTAPAAPAVSCAVAAHGTAATTPAEMPALRQQQAAAWADVFSGPLLRQADEQTLVG